MHRLRQQDLSEVPAVMRNYYRGWAVKVAYKTSGAPFLCGRYWQFGKVPQHIPQMEGHVVCLFTTRAKARAAIRTIRHRDDYYRSVAAVRVEVNVTPL